MTPGAKAAIFGTRFNPYRLAGNAAIYSMDGPAMDYSYIIDGSNRIRLISDRSGNSAVNGLVLPGTIGNYGSTPSSAPLNITGDIDLRAYVVLSAITPAATTPLISKDDQAANRAYGFYVITTGNLRAEFFVGGAMRQANSSVTLASLGLSDYTNYWLRATRTSADGNVNFYYSTDGSAWTSVGTVQSTTPGSIGTTTQELEVGRAAATYALGIIYRAQIYNGIAGTLVFDANFTAQAKLASSFTESSSNAATVTINTNGDTGARISGARDLVQLTQANQPIFSTGVDGRNIATFDGSNDYMRSAPFSFSQPESIYFVGSQVTWNSRSILDGGSATTGRLFQSVGTPALYLSAGVTLGAISPALQTPTIIRLVINSASSSIAMNTGTAITGNAGSAAMNGFTLGARGDAAATTEANITFSSALLRSASDDTTTQLRIAQYEIAKWGITP